MDEIVSTSVVAQGEKNRFKSQSNAYCGKKSLISFVGKLALPQLNVKPFFHPPHYYYKKLP